MEPRLLTDQMGRVISLNYPPRRIVSIVPSQTELLFDLGLDLELVGITKFCIHPEEKVKSRAKIGGTKKLNIQKIRELKPDLIIGNKEENDQDQVEQLMAEFPVWMSDIKVLDDALFMITSLGELTGTSQRALEISSAISSGFSTLATQSILSRTCIYFIWKDPYMVAGTDTFIDNILKRAGYNNIITASRYPEISADQLRELRPQLIFLSSEPYPFCEKHLTEMQNICPEAKVRIVDGEMFSWYGSRLQKTVPYLNSLNLRVK